MLLKKWDDLPDFLKTDKVRVYYDVLHKRRFILLLKRLFDFFLATILFIILLPLFIFLSIVIKIDSSGSVFFKQVRVTQYGKEFKILKFRTMIEEADKLGFCVTLNNDSRITAVGKYLRKCRLDEIPQLLNIIKGDMSFVGTRPEVPKYVKHYTDEMFATLLLPAGVTSEASVQYKDEDVFLKMPGDAEEIYIRDILPLKMKYNLDSLKSFSFFSDIKTMGFTLFAVMRRN